MVSIIVLFFSVGDRKESARKRKERERQGFHQAWVGEYSKAHHVSET